MINKKIELGYKIWLDNDGVAFGDGIYRLLKNIEISYSLTKAALSLKMSYRQAWGMIRDCEKKLGFPLIERQAGGASGGYSVLTPEGETLLYWYENLHSDIGRKIEEMFETKFKLLRDALKSKYIKS